MKHHVNSIRRLGLSLLFALCLFPQACQQNTVEPESRTPSTPDIETVSDATQESSTSQDSPQTSVPEVKEITYVAEKINPVAAQLTSQWANSKINVRSQPSTRSSAKHFGYSGDRITLLKQAEGEGKYLWYYLRFDQSKAEGWVRSDFVAQNKQKLRSRKSYRAYDFDADPWLSSFNQSYQSAKANNAPWLFDPKQVAQRVAGYPNPDGCEPDSVEKIESQDSNWVTVLIKSGEAQGEQCRDDSVAASHIRVDLIRDDQVWDVDWAGGRYRCLPGRGQQEFAPKLCR